MASAVASPMWLAISLEISSRAWSCNQRLKVLSIISLSFSYHIHTIINRWQLLRYWLGYWLGFLGTLSTYLLFFSLFYNAVSISTRCQESIMICLLQAASRYRDDPPSKLANIGQYFHQIQIWVRYERDIWVIL